MMSPLDQIKQFFPGIAKDRKLAGNQKACPKCRRVLHIEAVKCPSCAYSPWAWHPNSRFVLITLIIAAFLFILMPLLTAPDSSYGRHRSYLQDTR